MFWMIGENIHSLYFKAKPSKSFPTALYNQSNIHFKNSICGYKILSCIINNKIASEITKIAIFQ